MASAQQLFAAITATGQPPTQEQWQAYQQALVAESIVEKLPSNLYLAGDPNIKKQIKTDVNVLVWIINLCTPSGDKLLPPIVLQALRNPAKVFAHSAMRTSQTAMITELANPTGSSCITFEYLLTDPVKAAPGAGANLGERAALEALDAAIKEIVVHTVQRIMVQEVDTLRKVYNTPGTLSFQALHEYLEIHGSQFLLPWEIQKMERDKKKRPRFPGPPVS